MTDLFEDFNKILKQDLVPILLKYLNDQSNKITNYSDKFSKNNDNDIKERTYKDIENITLKESSVDQEYDDLFKRLTLIEENMIQIEKLIKDKNWET